MFSFAAGGTAVLHYLVKYAIGRSGGGGRRKVSLPVEKQQGKDDTDPEKRMDADALVRCRMEANQEKQRHMTEEFQKRVSERTVSIVSEDHLTLKGGYYMQEGSHLWAIVVHGYRGRHQAMINFAQRYYDAGYQVLMPDLRACGESEGKFISMGWLDAKDLLLWTGWILDTDPDAEIVLHGISMGAAAVMMASGQKTQEAVRAFVEDCGYTSAWDMFSSELKLRFHLPEFPVLYLASGMARVRAGYGLKEASALRQVKKCEKPMLFIHGDRDDFVPFDMLEILYRAKPGNRKQKIEVKGAGHGEASKVLGDDYWKIVFTFLSPYMEESMGNGSRVKEMEAE